MLLHCGQGTLLHIYYQPILFYNYISYGWPEVGLRINFFKLDIRIKNVYISAKNFTYLHDKNAIKSNLHSFNYNTFTRGN